ncbi:protein NETWORKED 4A-like isoform X2 [Macadamia integrifolia]|nr:protein NETWORKED 4A-like isoform X2 [Macadamia integrifolia]
MSTNLKRAETRKLNSWWGDSYISSKSSKWVTENLEEMGSSVKQMLKLIEGDGDSFAKKADMYYQKRPEIVSLVKDFYRMYSSLAERYNNLTGELRKNIPSEFNSQSSGIPRISSISSISDAGSEQISSIPIPNGRSMPLRSTHRAAGFDFFLSSAGGSSNDLTQKDGDHSSSSSPDSDLDSDDTLSVNNYSGPPVNDNGEGVLHRRIIELEIELGDLKERLHEDEEGNRDGGNAKTADNNSNYEKLLGKMAGYEEQLRLANEKLKLAEEEISRLKRKLGDDETMKLTHSSQAQLELAQKDIQVVETDNKSGEGRSFDLQEEIAGLATSVSALDSGSSIEILKIANRRLRDKEDEIARLKFEQENDKRSLEEGTSDRVCQVPVDGSEIIELEADVLREEISKIAQNSSAEERLEAEISKVTEERDQQETKLRDWESRGRSLEEEIERLEVGIAQRGDDVEALNKDLGALKLKYDMLVAERDGLKAKVETMMAEVSCRDDRIEHMKRLHMEQMEMLVGAERGRKVMEELGGKVRGLEEEVERQRMVISNGEEEKREAIRQLCFSLDHYRNGYLLLRQAFIGNNKRHSILAS